VAKILVVDRSLSMAKAVSGKVERLTIRARPNPPFHA